MESGAPEFVMEMTRDHILKKLEENLETIRGFGVRRLGIFGSYARNEHAPASDMDFLVEFDNATFDNYFDLKFSWKTCLGDRLTSLSQTRSSPEYVLPS